MKKHVFSLAVAAIALMAASGAQANDWRSGLYVKGSAGWNHAQDSEYGGGETEYDEGYALSGAVGYDYGDVRTEFEITYRNNDVDTHSAAGVNLPNSGGDISSTAFMFNGYYDIPTGGPVTPYVGAGIGVAQVNVNDFRAGAVRLADDDDTVFAYQAMAGAEYAIAPNLGLFAEYKYFATQDADIANTDVEYDNHAIMAGLKYSFN